MIRGYHITGTVSNSSLHTVDGVDVSAIPQDPTLDSYYGYTGDTSPGSFSILVPPGHYTLHFAGDDESVTSLYLNGCYNSAATGHYTVDCSDASDLNVTTDTNLYVTLISGTVVGGKVTNGHGQGLADLQISMVSTSPAYSVTTTTDSIGNYSVAVLPGGSYSIEVTDSLGLYADGFYCSTCTGAFTLSAGARTLLDVASTPISNLNMTIPSLPDAPTKVVPSCCSSTGHRQTATPLRSCRP